MTTDWKQDYSVGHPLLDEQHKAFFTLCKEAEACRSDASIDGQEQYHVLLNELVVYAKRHFITEEGLLAQYDYPLLARQQAEHEAYHETLTEFIFEATFGDLDQEGLFAYLTGWWTEHILTSDLKYREFLRERAD